MARFLLLDVGLILVIVYFVIRALQNSNSSAKLQKIKVEKDELDVLKTVDLQELKKQRAELARIKREME